MNSIPEIAILCLNTSAFVYLAACLSYFFALSTAGSKKEGMWSRIASWSVVVAFVLHTAGLLLRWYVGGISRPPWTNLYESLVFFSWGIAAVQVYGQKEWKLPWVGAISVPFIFVLMGMSVMTPNKAIEPLIPALQSYWLKIHVVFGMTAYASFTVAACLAFLHLMRNGMYVSRIAVGLALAALFCLSVSGGGEIFSQGKFYMAKTAKKVLADGQEVSTKDTYREYEGGPPVTRMEEVPGANKIFFFSFFCYLISAGLFWKGRHRGRASWSEEELKNPDKLVSRLLDFKKPALVFFILGYLGLLGLFVSIKWAMRSSQTLTWHSNPYLVLLLLLLFFFCTFFLLSIRRYSAWLKRLPDPARLEELSYKNILFGFPFQTLLLITGAIWAYYAWGRSWGWDPKETWALITWFAYLIYLHGKLLMRWKANTLSTWALINFLILIFAFLGVNLVLSGLHSYGSA